MRLGNILAVLGTTVFAMPALAASPPPTSWEIAGQFRPVCPGSGGGNVWTYGTRPAAPQTGPFTPLTVNFNQGAPSYLVGCDLTGSASFPLVMHMNRTLPNSAFSVTWAARSLVLHPGPSGERAVVRFTAPYSATYTLSGRFYGIDGNSSQTTTNVLIEKVVGNNPANITSVWSGVIDLPTSIIAASFTSQTVSLLAGERIEFSVGFGANNFNFDSTGLHGVIECSRPLPGVTSPC